MKCPACNSGQLIITNTRGTDWGVRRTRVCLSCGAHIPTIEINKVTEEAIKSLEKSKTIIRHRKEGKEN